MTTSTSSPTGYVPERGDVIWLDFDPQLGHEQAKTRPALVLSPAKYNAKVGLALVCPITSKVKKYAWAVKVPNGLPVNGAVLSDQLKSQDWRKRRAAFICKMPQATVIEVIKRFSVLLK